MLFSDSPNAFLQEKAKQWNENIALPVDEKVEIAGLDVENISPFNKALSDEINVVAFNRSFLTQPDLFIRIRPGKNDIVKTKLQTANIFYTEINPHCLSFANGTKLENILAINSEAVIQDMNSQRVGDMFALMNLPEKATVWDCCAANEVKFLATNFLFQFGSIGHVRYKGFVVFYCSFF